MQQHEIRSKADFRDDFATAVHVIGTYTEVDVRKRQDGPPVHRGHAAIRLQDGTLVFLAPPWSGEAIRSAQEREQYRGKQVAALGLFSRHGIDNPAGGASIVAPCLMAIGVVMEESLYLLVTEDDD